MGSAVRYVRIKDAVRITGEKENSLRYMIRVKNIKYRRLPSGGLLVGLDDNSQLVYEEVSNA